MMKSYVIWWKLLFCKTACVSVICLSGQICIHWFLSSKCLTGRGKNVREFCRIDVREPIVQVVMDHG